MGDRVYKLGDRCAGCEVVTLLGAGGFAEVYEVVDPRGERRALKTLALDAEARPKLRARLAQEGSALAMIRHPNVVRMFDMGFDRDRLFLLLELVRGQSLRATTAALGGRIDPRTLTAWMAEAGEGIVAAHAAGVVHRDLKPENLLVTVTEHVKVIDFGIAKLASSGVKTTSEQRVGTALYMAPEHIQQMTVDPRVDQYSLGLVMYEALTGKHPIVSGPATLMEVCARQMSHRPRPLVLEAPWVPADLAALVDRAIEKDPARRFPSMRAMVDALADAYARMPATRASVPDSMKGGSSPVSSSPGSSRISKGFGGTAPLPTDIVRGALHVAPTADLSGTNPALATRDIGASSPLGTTSPGTESTKVPVAAPTAPSHVLPVTVRATVALDTLPSPTMPAPKASPVVTSASPRASGVKLVVAAIALTIGLGAGVATAITIDGARKATKPAVKSPTNKR